MANWATQRAMRVEWDEWNELMTGYGIAISTSIDLQSQIGRDNALEETVISNTKS